MRIKTAQYLISSPNTGLCPPPDRPEYAFIGRSNVGKSSLINMLTGNTKLAKISNSPGKTQMINHFEVVSIRKEHTPPVQWYLVDLPGYGFAKISLKTRRKWEVMTEEYFRQRENLMQIFLLIDSRHSPQKTDLEFIKKLFLLGTAPFTLVFTKSDKEKQRVVHKNVQAMLEEIGGFSQFLPRHIVTSALKKLGRDKLLEVIDELNEDFREDESLKVPK